MENNILSIECDNVAQNEVTAEVDIGSRLPTTGIINSYAMISDSDNDSDHFDAASLTESRVAAKKRGRPRISRASLPMIGSELSDFGAKFVFLKEDLYQAFVVDHILEHEPTQNPRIAILHS